MTRFFPCIAILSGVVWSSAASGQSAFPDEAVAFFEEDITEIIQENCIKCHGGEKVESGLDMTTRGRMLRGGSRGPAVDLENPASSVLLEMISYKDKEHEMPPPGKLMQFDIGALTEWIEMGLPWTPGDEMEAEDAPDMGMVVSEEDKQYWAYQPVTRPEPPKVTNSDWQNNPIDAFVLARLQGKGLSPSPESDKAALIRRAYYDLTGLPPTPEEVQAFVADTSVDAYEKVIDHLLASPHYGERWARHWLDLVRYADSNGFERDEDKPNMWRYRDYVIDSFNADKPYDQFIREQLAGDEMPNASADQITATGYYRLGQWDDEPADPLLNKYDTLDDIVDTTAKTFLGITMGCARCHGHKIDPIPHEDYYRFMAFFHNISEMKRVKGFEIQRDIMTPVERSFQNSLMLRQKEDEARLVAEYYEYFERFKAAARDEKPELLEDGNWEVSDLEDVSYRFYRSTWDDLPDFDSVKPEDKGKLPHNYISLSPATRDDAIGFVFEGKVRVPEKGDYTFIIESTDNARLSFGRKEVVSSPGDNKEHRDKIALKKGMQSFRLEFINKTGKPDLKLAWFGPSFGKRTLSISGKKNAKDLQKVSEAIRQYGEELLGKEAYSRYQEVGKEIDEVRNRDMGGKYAVAVSEEGPQFPETHLLLRGNPHAKGAPVQPGFPAVLSPPDVTLPERGPKDETTGLRTILANWLADESNPLTARVMVNRIWQHHFGRGIVRSTSNFGKSGNAPTHPQLLDWLADEFMANGWHMKPLHKQIMMSRTYRQGSAPREPELSKDPNNNLFWRYDMRRLSAEELRDTVLSVTGTLNPKLHGPTIYTVLPDEVLATSSKKENIVKSGIWGISSDENAARRSVYIHLKRSLQPPILTDFDFADLDDTCPVRFATTQPAQSLHMLNSDFFHQQAVLLRERMWNEGGASDAERIGWGFEQITGRAPTQDEVSAAKKFLSEMQVELGADETLAWDRFALLLLNLNEFIFLD